MRENSVEDYAREVVRVWFGGNISDPASKYETEFVRVWCSRQGKFNGGSSVAAFGRFAAWALRAYRLASAGRKTFGFFNEKTFGFS